MQRLQFDTGEQLSRKEYLKRKRKNSKLLRKRSKITYILLAIFIALAIYIVVQVVVYRKYNSFKYTAGDNINNQSIYNILFVTEGYTYNPSYSVNSILSSGENEKNFLPESNLEQITVTQNLYYGLRDGVICSITRDKNEITEIVNDNVKKFILHGENLIYTTKDNETLKKYHIPTGVTTTYDISSVKQILANDKYIFGITHNSSERSIYAFGFDGSGKKKISGDEQASYAIVDKDTIYFVNRKDENKIYKVKDTGDELGKVADIKCVSHYSDTVETNGKKYMFVNNNKLYYINTADEDALYSYDLQTNENTKVISASVEILQNVDSTIFYKIQKETGVYLYNFDTKFMSLVTKRRVKEFVIDPFVDVKVQL